MGKGVSTGISEQRVAIYNGMSQPAAFWRRVVTGSRQVVAARGDSRQLAAEVAR